MTVGPRRLLILLLIALLAAVCGCRRAQTRTAGAVPGQPDKPIESTVISPQGEADSSAYADADKELSAAQWQVLEKYAPRSDWKRLTEVRDTYIKPAAPPSTADGVQPEKTRAPAPRDVTEIERADGRVDIYYRLWHYGGANITTTRINGYQQPNVTVTDPSLDSLIQLVETHLGDKGVVKALASENMLVITCDPTLRSSVRQLLEKVDVSRRQVEITVRIFEVSDDFDFELGVKTLVRRLGNSSSQGYVGAFDIASFAGEIVDPLNATVPSPGSALKLIKAFQSAGVDLDITFQAMAETGLIKVVSSPRLTVSVGQRAFMMAGQELPVREGTLTNDKFITEKISYKPIGVQLFITPQTVGDYSVKLHMLTVVSAISGFAPLPTTSDFSLHPSLINPIIDSRQAETVVEVPHGSTLVVGGLRMVRKVTREQKVPLVGDIPLLGWLFKNHRSQSQLNDLYFFVTPRLVEPAD